MCNNYGVIPGPVSAMAEKEVDSPPSPVPHDSGSLALPQKRYNTRQSVRLAEVAEQSPRKVQIFSVPQSEAEESDEKPVALPAGSQRAQRSFLPEVGIVTTDVDPLEDILTGDDAELLSCALSHQCVEGTSVYLSDPHFTKDQWQLVLNSREALIDAGEQLVKDILDTEQVQQVSQMHQKAKTFLEKKREVPLCACKAHMSSDSDLYLHVISALVTIQPPLNDDSGNELASILLSYILKMADLQRLTFRGTRGGARGKVKYILRGPSGTEYLYSGWPDFQIIQKFSTEERQLRRPIGAGVQEGVRAIGEVQSPPGYSHDAKNRAFAQAGIYTLGHLSNTTTVSKLTTVILYKDLTAHIACTTVHRASDASIGDVTYKLVHSLNPFNLQNATDLKAFASIFIASIKSTLV